MEVVQTEDDQITGIVKTEFNTPDPNEQTGGAEGGEGGIGSGEDGGGAPPAAKGGGAGAQESEEEKNRKQSEADKATRQKHIEDFFSEKTQGKYKSLEDYEKEIVEKAKSEIKIPKLSERLKKLQELEEKGVDIEKAIEFQRKGYDKLDPQNITDAKKLLFEKWSDEEPGITEKELEYKFKTSFKAALKTAEDEGYDAEETEIAKLSLTRNAGKIKNELLAKQKELELPANKPDLSQELAAAREKWKNATEPFVKEYKEETFKIAEGNEIKFLIDDSKRTKLQEAIIDPTTYILNKCSVKSEDGSVKTDIPKLRRILAVVENADEIVKSVHDAAFSAGAKAEIEKIENLEKGGGAGAPEGGEVLSAEKVYADYLKNRNKTS